MIAFVFSGGGNRGPLQIGALARGEGACVGSCPTRA